ncbi:glycosyltransferase family protein, partial [Falsiroseomonas selenitidurans]
PGEDPGEDPGRARDADLALKLNAADLACVGRPAAVEPAQQLAPRTRVIALPPALGLRWLRPRRPGPRNGRLLCLAPPGTPEGRATLLQALALLPAAQRPVIDLPRQVHGLVPLMQQAAALGLAPWLDPRLEAEELAQAAPAWLGLLVPEAAAAIPGLLHGMALQLPVLAVGEDLADIVLPGFGHLLPPGQPQPLARGLRWLSLMPEDQRLLFGRAARDQVLAQHTAERRAARLLQALGRCAPRRARRA